MWIAKQMIVQEVKMSAGQAQYFGQCVVNGLRVKRLAAPVKSLFVTKVAGMWAATRDNNRVRYQIQMPFDQTPPDRWNAEQRSDRRAIDLRGCSGTKILQEGGPDIFARTEKD